MEKESTYGVLHVLPYVLIIRQQLMEQIVIPVKNIFIYLELIVSYCFIIFQRSSNSNTQL